MEKNKEERKWTNKEMIEMAQMMFHSAEEDLEKHMDSMVERAERLVVDLKQNRGYFNDYKKEGRDNQLMTRGGTFESAINTIENCFSNYRFSDAARKLAKYEKAKALLKTFKGEKVSLW